MSGQIVDFHKPPHQATQELLPWYANGSLDADEHRALTLHLESCAECRRELEALRHMQSSYLAGDAATLGSLDIDGALARLAPLLTPHVPVNAVANARDFTSKTKSNAETNGATHTGTSPQVKLPAPVAPAPTRPPAAPARGVGLLWQSGGRPASLVGFALAAQFGVIVALGWALWTWQHAPAQFHAMGAAQSPVRAEGDAIIVFNPDVEERQMRRLLKETGARIVDGPTAANGYVIRFERGDAEAALARLGSDPSVHLVARLRPAGGS